jgi:regulator of sigma E protease
MNSLLADSVLSSIWSVLLAILVLLVMITVHEFGHYLAGKALKFKINEFSIGFGPAIFKHKRKKDGEQFSLRVLPLGGYCAFEEENEESFNPDAFNNKAPWKRIIVLIAGATMNYLLALVVILMSFSIFGQPAYKLNTVAESDTISTEYSFVDGDIILAAEGKTIYIITDAMGALNGKKEGDVAYFTVVRDGEQKDVEIILRADCTFKNSSSESQRLLWKALGAGTYVAEDGNSYYNLAVKNCTLNFGQIIGHSFAYSFKLAGTIFKVLGELLTGNLNITAMGGTVTTIKIASEAVVAGAQSFLEIVAVIGVNLAVFNLLPIPALDGSKVVFCIIEWIFKKPVPRKIEAIIHAVGFVLILGFALLADILQFAACG